MSRALQGPKTLTPVRTQVSKLWLTGWHRLISRSGAGGSTSLCTANTGGERD